METMEDPTVFDNPETQTVEFAVNSDAHIINNVETDSEPLVAEPTPKKNKVKRDDDEPIEMEIKAAKDGTGRGSPLMLEPRIL